MQLPEGTKILLQRVPTQLAIKVVKKIDGFKSIETTTKSSIQVFPATEGKLKLDYRMYVVVFGV